MTGCGHGVWWCGLPFIPPSPGFAGEGRTAQRRPNRLLHPNDRTRPGLAWLRGCIALLLAVVSLSVCGRVAGDDGERLRSEVLALGNLTKPPVTHPAEGFTADDGLRPL